MGDNRSSVFVAKLLKAGTLLILLILCKYSKAAVPFNELFPASESNDGTETFDFKNTFSTEVQLGFTFQYSTVNYTSIYINANGVLSFGKRNQNYGYKCHGEIQAYGPAISVFWARVSSSSQNGGRILYQTTQNPTLLKKAANDIFYAFSRERHNLTNLFIVTWQNVASKQQILHGSGQNSFQVVLATDSVRSFVLFYFHQIQWPKPSIEKAVSGFLSWSDTAPYFLGSPCTGDVNNVVVNNSNVNSPGKWVFQVDGLEIQETGICNNVDTRRGEWSQNVQFVSLLGKGALIFTDRCIDLLKYKSALSVSCAFGNLKDAIVVGEHVENSGVVCEIPYLNTLGLTEVTVMVNVTEGGKLRSIRYNFPLSVVRNEDLGETVNFKVTNSPLENHVSVEATWSAGAFNLNESWLGAVEKRELAFVLLERLTKSRWSEAELKTWNLNQTAISMFRHIHEFISSELLNDIQSPLHPIFAVRYRLTLQNGKTVSKQLISDVLVAERILQIVETAQQYNFLSSLKCKNMYDETTVNVPESGITNCPHSGLQAEMDFRFARDYSGENLHHNPEPVTMYTQIFSKSVSSQIPKCVYDKNGDPIIGAPNGNRLDYFSQYDKANIWSHYDIDILPYWHCCRANTTDLCQNFYQKRDVSSQKRKSVTPSFASVFGLGHVISFGSSESFAINETTGLVWLAKFQNKNTDSALQIQGYFVPFRQTSSATLNAIAIRDIFNGITSTVECSASHNSSSLLIKVKVGTNTEFKFEETHLWNRKKSLVYHENFHILKGTATSVVLIFKSGFSANVVLHEYSSTSWLSVVVQQSTPVITTSSMLLWGYLYQNSSVKATHLQHRVRDDDSVFLTKLEVPQSKSSFDSPPENMQLDFHGCDKQAECLFDFRMTRDFTFARITKECREQQQRFLNAFAPSDTSKSSTDSGDQLSKFHLDFTCAAIGGIVGIALVIALLAALKKCKTAESMPTTRHAPEVNEQHTGILWDASVVYRK